MRRFVNNNKGFSLVELMVVVAIIGILAAIAVPNFQRFTAKSKQSEAKSELSAIYSAERAFFAEWQQFIGGFNQLGYNPTGTLRYNHGFSASNNTPLTYPTNPNTVPAAATLSAAGICGVAPAFANNCSLITGPVPPGAVAAAVSGAAVFTAQARGDIDGDATVDIWTVNQDKQFAQPAANDDVNN